MAGHGGRRPRGAFFPGAAPEPGWKVVTPTRSMGPMANKEVRG
jgi:hypothetical protein